MRIFMATIVALGTLLPLAGTAEAGHGFPGGSYGRGHGHYSYHRGFYGGPRVTFHSGFYGGYRPGIHYGHGHFGHGRHGHGGHYWHDTSHFDYHPGGYIRHYDHYDYVPAHWDWHQEGHWDHH